MKKLSLYVFLVLMFCNSAYASNLNPEKILNNVDDIYRSNASYGILTLSVTTTNWQRTLTLEQWSKGKDKHLIRVLKAKKRKRPYYTSC